MTAPPLLPRRGRLAAALVLAWVFGAVVSVLVAWFAAWAWDPEAHTEALALVDRPEGSASPVLQLQVMRHRTACSVVTWVGALTERWSPDPEALSDAPMAELTRPWPPGEVYAALADPAAWPSDIGVQARQVAGAYAFGWPAPCLWNRVTYDGVLPGSGYRWEGAWEVKWIPRRAFPWMPLTLPVRPLWTGLALNSALYGAAALAVVFGVPVARRAWRRRRGLCLACGYDLRGDFAGGCPECGWQRPGAEAVN